MAYTIESFEFVWYETLPDGTLVQCRVKVQRNDLNDFLFTHAILGTVFTDVTHQVHGKQSARDLYFDSVTGNFMH